MTEATKTVEHEFDHDENLPEELVGSKGTSSKEGHVEPVQVHPADEIAMAFSNRYGNAPAFMLSDVLASDKNEDLTMIHVIEQAVSFLKSQDRVTDAGLARVAVWFNSKYGKNAA